MTQAAQLRAGDLVVADPVRDEPHRDVETGHRVLLHPHLKQAEAVNDVLARQVDQSRSIDRQNQLVDRRDVVLGARVGAIESDWILGRDLGDVGAAKLAVRPGVLHVPGELLADHLHDHSFVFRRELRHAPRPRGDGIANQQMEYETGLVVKFSLHRL